MPLKGGLKGGSAIGCGRGCEIGFPNPPLYAMKTEFVGISILVNMLARGHRALAVFVSMHFKSFIFVHYT